MRLLHNNGEDKPPLNLSTDDISNCDSRRSPVQPSLAENDSISTINASTHGSLAPHPSQDHEHPTTICLTSIGKQGHPHEGSSAATATAPNVSADRCRIPSARQASFGEEAVVRHDPANTQAPNHQASAISHHNAASASASAPSSNNSKDESISPVEAAVVKDDNTYPEGGLAAWLVVFGSFSGMVASFGVLNTVGTFQAYLSTHQLAKHSPSSIGWIFSIYAFLTFFCGVQIGPVFDAKGPRWLVAAGSLFLFAGMMGVAESTGTSGFSKNVLWISFC